MTMTVGMLQKAFLYEVLLHLWPISLKNNYQVWFFGRAEGVNPAILLKTGFLHNLIDWFLNETGFHGMVSLNKV